jgi:DNA-binding XRE family transcriptional regulator
MLKVLLSLICRGNVGLKTIQKICQCKLQHEHCLKLKKQQIMKQPELGKKILELRKQKGFTQEELVAQCNINVRTIQRIEAADVSPRSYTVKAILEVLGFDYKNIFEESCASRKFDKVLGINKGEVSKAINTA